MDQQTVSLSLFLGEKNMHAGILDLGRLKKYSGASLLASSGSSLWNQTGCTHVVN